MKYYHGTTMARAEEGVLLPPDLSGFNREGRIKNLDVVFLTNSIPSAEKYAMKAVKEYGGTPVVCEVDPCNPCEIDHNGETICDYALIKAVTKFSKPATRQREG